MDKDMVKVRKNIYLRPWVVKELDKERAVRGVSFSVYVDEIVEDHLRQVVRERLRAAKLAQTHADTSIDKYMDIGPGDAGLLPTPPDDADVFPLPGDSDE